MDPINLQYTTIKSPLPDFIYEDLKRFSSDANGYKPQPEELVSMLAEKHGVKNENIFLTAGVDEALQMFIKAYGSIGLVFTPTYTVYRDIEVFGGKMISRFSLKNNTYEIDTSNEPEAKLIFLANPNNPLGFTEKEKIKELIENNPQARIVVDQAYGEFAPELSVIDWINKYPNLAVTKSFSKDYGMAGNRIGYIIAQPELIASVKDFTQWSNISYLSVGAAISALNHEEYFSKMRDEIIKGREDFNKFLVDSGFIVFPSKINAIVAEFDSEDEGTRFVKHLNSNNITVSHGNGNSNIGMDLSFVRIVIGTKTQMEIVKKVISNYPKD